MAEREIVWTKTADLQLIGVLKYWVNKNKSNSYSLKLLNTVTERTIQLASHPELYPQTDVDKVRIIALKNHSVLYRFSKNQIIIVAFWDNRQDPKKLLKILKEEFQ